MRRVVVTGLGLVTPLGGDVETTWKNILAGKSGIGPITRFDVSDQKAKIAGEVKPKDHENGFDPDKRVDSKIQRQVDPFIVTSCTRGSLARTGASQDTARFSALMGVRPRTETFPLEQADQAFARVMENKVRFRAVLTP